MPPSVNAIAPWFGCARMIAPEVGEMLKGSRWIGIPFGGGMPEVQVMQANTILVNDLHRHVINLARVIRCSVHGSVLYRRLQRTVFHPDVLRESQEWCAQYEPSEVPDVEAAYHYFISCWMGRSAKSGTEDEFKGNLPIRWKDGGGDSNVRFRSATQSIMAWRKTFRRCNFTVMDAFDFLDRIPDEDRSAIYADPPSFPGATDCYRFKFSPEQHVRLANKLASFKKLRVVVRFYAHDNVREWYPAGESMPWIWKYLQGGRKQSNDAAPEVLIWNKR